MNITDVGHLTSDGDTGDDKMLKGAKREHKTVMEIAKFYTDAFFDDCKKLNIKTPDVVAPATTYIDEFIKVISSLMEKDTLTKPAETSISIPQSSKNTTFSTILKRKTSLSEFVKELKRTAINAIKPISFSGSQSLNSTIRSLNGTVHGESVIPAGISSVPA